MARSLANLTLQRIVEKLKESLKRIQGTHILTRHLIIYEMIYQISKGNILLELHFAHILNSVALKPPINESIKTWQHKDHQIMLKLRDALNRLDDKKTAEKPKK